MSTAPATLITLANARITPGPGPVSRSRPVSDTVRTVHLSARLNEVALQTAWVRGSQNST
jgi:hypothetical protein